ncbi:MAG: hypothetical protein RLZZ519_25 [Bacteroidota bacterium]|jgi:predicted glycoside hydrolase/deacetylase ChbG (UPF0249 family)
MKVVVNADDFGSTARHTRLILQLLQAGKISSTTFLVNLPYSEEAGKKLRENHPELRGRVGLHFNLIEGKPLNPRLLDSPFVAADKQFKDFRGRVPVFLQLLYLRKLMTELNLQIDRFHQLTGTYPTHIDSHGHTHCTFVMLLALLFAKNAGKVKAIRLTRQYDHEPSQLVGVKNKLRRFAKHLLNLGFRLRFRTVRYFTDIRNIDRSWLTSEQLKWMAGKFDSVEIMCHPYMFDESEFEFLSVSPNFLEATPDIELVAYSEII